MKQEYICKCLKITQQMFMDNPRWVEHMGRNCDDCSFMVRENRSRERNRDRRSPR